MVLITNNTNTSIGIGNGEELGPLLLRGVSRGPRTPSLPKNFTPSLPIKKGSLGILYLIIMINFKKVNVVNGILIK